MGALSGLEGRDDERAGKRRGSDGQGGAKGAKVCTLAERAEKRGDLVTVTHSQPSPSSFPSPSRFYRSDGVRGAFRAIVFALKPDRRSCRPKVLGCMPKVCCDLEVRKREAICLWYRCRDADC